MELYQYKYSIRDVVITTSRTTIEIQDGSVVYLFISHDYINRRLPIIKMQIELNYETISAIYDDVESALIKFDLYEHQTDTDGNTIDTTLYMRHSYSIIPSKDKINYITSDDIETESSVDDMRKFQLFETYLIDMPAVTWFTKQISTIFKDASRPDALQALLEMRDIPSNITIATPPENFDIVNYMVLPIGDLIGNIIYMNNRYGLYNSIPIIYYDGEYFYCINKIDPNITIKSAKDYNTITIIANSPTDPARNIMGSCNDPETKTHYINLREVPEITDLTNKISSTKFATITSVDKDGTVEKITLDDSATSLAYVYAQHELTVDQIINEYYIGHTVSLQANNCAVSFIKPYKNVTFDVGIQLKNLNLTGHDYRIIGWTLSITREGSASSASYIHDITMNLVNPKFENKT